MTDAAGNSDTDTTTVTVLQPDTSNVTAAIEPSNATVFVGSTTTVDLVLRNASDGLDAYNLTLSTVGTTSGNVSIADASVTNETDTVAFGSANRTLTLAGTVNATGDNATVATLTLAGDVAGDANLTIAVENVTTSAGAEYDVVSTQNATLTVSEGIPSLTPGGNPPSDLDGDDQLEDVDGNGEGDIFDAITYYNNRNSDVIQDNPAQFDFDGDGTPGTIFDAIALFNEL